MRARGGRWGGGGVSFAKQSTYSHVVLLIWFRLNIQIAMQAASQATSNADILQIPLFHTQEFVRPSDCASPSTHVPVLARAAASLQSSIAESANSAAHALHFLTESSNKLAAAYEQLSACTFAAHSLRRRSPRLLPDDVMRCCRVSFAARSSTVAADEEIPYPIVWGIDFEVRCGAASRRVYDAAENASSALGSSSNMIAPSPKNVRAAEDVGDHRAKRARTEPHLLPALLRGVGDVADAEPCAPEANSQPALVTPLGNQDFEWLPGNGVL
jgi:hypothetical protein